MTTIPHGNIPWWKTRFAFALLCFVVIGVVLLAIDHWHHVFGGWPLLFLLVCPLLHIFLHGGHRKQHKHAEPRLDDRAS
jgi:hypothetical protein